MTCPVAMSKAANNVVVPCRLYPWLNPSSALPLGSRSQPCARSKAWIDGFSSTHKTKAFSGGLKYSPTMSAAFFRAEFRIRADAPTPPPLQANVVLAQDTPDLIVTDVSERQSHQLPRPLGVAFRRRFVQQRQHPFLGCPGIVGRAALAVRVPQTVQPPFGKALPPLRDAGRPGPQLLRNLQIGLALMGQQDDLSPLNHPMFTGTGACPLPERPLLIRGQRNRRPLAHIQIID